MLVQPRSLKQRTLIFALLPTLALLLTLSFAGFIIVKDILLEQWSDSATARLENTAAKIDSKLSGPRQLLMMLKKNSPQLSPEFSKHVLRQIKALEGVVQVEVKKEELLDGLGPSPEKNTTTYVSRISPPKLNNHVAERTISLTYELDFNSSNATTTVEVTYSFDDLIIPLTSSPWWTNNKAFILDGNYNVLITSAPHYALEDLYPMRVYGSLNEFEEKTIQAIVVNNYGTVFGSGTPPDEIAVFFHLMEVPWTIVISAPGHEVLQPIYNFRYYYIVSFGLGIVLVLLFIRLSLNQVTTGINKVSEAARELANGNFGSPLKVTSRDEVGALTADFNKMTGQLKQRLLLKKDMDLAREVQQNLLPQKGYEGTNFTIFGKAIYCDATGGDYFDILPLSSQKTTSDKVAVVVGDVVGHGIGAALLMATLRALIRSGCQQGDPPGQMLQNVNQLLHQDTEISGNFATLYYLELEESGTIRWVRAGHDPAILLDKTRDKMLELKGEGIALAISPDSTYPCNQMALKKGDYVILTYSDGAVEVTNGAGEPFGKKRLEQALKLYSDHPPEQIVFGIAAEIDNFAQDSQLEDDVTLAAISISSG